MKFFSSLILISLLVTCIRAEPPRSTLFNLDNYPLFFENEIEAELVNLITADIGLLLNGREFVLDDIFNSSQLIDIEGRQIAWIDYAPNESDNQFPEILWLQHEPDLIQKAFEKVVEIDGEEGLYLPQRMVDIYSERLLFRENNANLFDELNLFVDRLNNIESEELSNETLIDLVYRREKVDIVESYEGRSITELLTSFQGEYSPVSLLDVAPIEFALGGPELPGISNELLMAQFEFVPDTEIEGLSAGAFYMHAIYVNGRWFLWQPLY